MARRLRPPRRRSVTVREGTGAVETGPERTWVRIGNDVVDLLVPRTVGKAADARFLLRVCAPEEREAVARADDPDRELWCQWAAKEAAYKVVSKELGAPPPFVHAAFVVELEPWAVAGPGGLPVRVGRVRYGDARVPVRIEQPADVLHAVAVSAGGGGGTLAAIERLEAWEAAPVGSLGSAAQGRGPPAGGTSVRTVGAEEGFADLLARLTERESEAVYSRASAAVRLAARADVARALDVEERRVEIVCAPGAPGRRPPQVLLDGGQAPADVSLSHHGGWLGWAVLVR